MQEVIGTKCCQHEGAVVDRLMDGVVGVNLHFKGRGLFKQARHTININVCIHFQKRKIFAYVCFFFNASF